MSDVELCAACATDPLPHPPGLAVDTSSDEEGARLVLSFPLAAEVPAKFTRAEREVIEGILAGLPNRAIAARRGVSPRTVANQIARLFAKLRVGSRLTLAIAVRGASFTPASR